MTPVSFVPVRMKANLNPKSDSVAEFEIRDFLGIYVNVPQLEAT